MKEYYEGAIDAMFWVKQEIAAGKDTGQIENDIDKTFGNIGKKLAETFDAHCVDSWVLASFVTGKSFVDNTSMFRIIPLQLHRRQLHRFEPETDGIRKPYGGTHSLGLRRGSVVNHTKLGMVYVGGASNGHISLHDVKSGKRLTQSGSIKDCNFLHYNNSWRTDWVMGIASHD